MEFNLKWKKIQVDQRSNALGTHLWEASVGGWLLEAKVASCRMDGTPMSWSASVFAPGRGVFGGDLVAVDRETNIESAEKAMERCEKLLDGCVGSLLEALLADRSRQDRAELDLVE